MKHISMFIYTLITFAIIAGCGSIEWFPDETKPDPFSFSNKSNVDISSTVVSDAVNVTGNSASTIITVSNGEVSFDPDPEGDFSGSAVLSAGGGVIYVRHTSAATANTATVTTVTIGGQKATFTSITRNDLSIKVLAEELTDETSVASINFKLTLPQKAYLKTNSDGSVDQSAAYVSGETLGTATLELLQYNAPTETSSASVIINLFSSNPYSALQPTPGEFMTLNILYPDGVAVSSNNVSFSDITFKNLSGTSIAGGFLNFSTAN